MFSPSMRLRPPPSPGAGRVVRPRLRCAALLAVLVLLLAGSACAGSSARDDDPLAESPRPDDGHSVDPSEVTTTTTTTTSLAVEPAGRVLVLGDSGMFDAAPAVVAMFQSTGAEAVDGSRRGLGLTRVGFESESSPFAEEWARMVEADDPELVVVMLGVWDGGFVELYGADAYAEVVEQAVAVLTAGGSRVLWLSTPPDRFVTERPADQVFEQVASNHPGRVFYADIDAAVRAPDGTIPVAYRAVDGTLVRLRKNDGWHFCPDGAAAVATEIGRLAVERGLSWPAGNEWLRGAWRDAGVFDYPECGP
jgi:hypothetical protein